MHCSKQLLPLYFISLQVLEEPTLIPVFLSSANPLDFWDPYGLCMSQAQWTMTLQSTQAMPKRVIPHPSSDIDELDVNGTHPRSRATIFWLLSCFHTKNAAGMSTHKPASSAFKGLSVSKCPSHKKLRALDQQNTQLNDMVSKGAPRWARWSKGDGRRDSSACIASDICSDYENYSRRPVSCLSNCASTLQKPQAFRVNCCQPSFKNIQ